MWVKREVLFALQQRRYENKIVPILFQPCDAGALSWTLPAFQTMDLVNGIESGYRQLLRIWGLGYTPLPATDEMNNDHRP